MIFRRTWLRGPITAPMVHDFCAASLDFNEIHLSRDAAVGAGLEDGPIVHGMMLYGIIEACVAEIDGYHVIKFSLQFVQPLLVNSAFQVETRVLRESAKELALRVLAKNIGGKPIAVGEALLRQEYSPAL